MMVKESEEYPTQAVAHPVTGLLKLLRSWAAMPLSNCSPAAIRWARTFISTIFLTSSLG